ncbi:42e84627-57fc-4de4-89ed-4b4e503f428b [Sclerotinia trifoliorum]|uniref:42e84627-57fc-4de4-89ed-4b4e503f428b n=1 Tax=Sclerotinia trifoliorum TaxID=28548 RepID=A0A8H2VLP8_9HELO|nr:42e84627-57fc-4de4-89ed-4b4e503f428b [Sclerotinia trifoliorum]
MLVTLQDRWSFFLCSSSNMIAVFGSSGPARTQASTSKMEFSANLPDLRRRLLHQLVDEIAYSDTRRICHSSEICIPRRRLYRH